MLFPDKSIETSTSSFKALKMERNSSFVTSSSPPNPHSTIWSNMKETLQRVVMPPNGISVLCFLYISSHFILLFLNLLYFFKLGRFTNICPEYPSFSATSSPSLVNSCVTSLTGSSSLPNPRLSSVNISSIILAIVLVISITCNVAPKVVHKHHRGYTTITLFLYHWVFF